MLIAIYFTVILFGLLFNKSRIVRVLQYATIYIVFVFNSWNQDDEAYRKIYSGYYGASHEPAFDFLCKFCYSREISYDTFRYIFINVAVVLLLIGLNILFKQANNRAYSLIMLYPLLPFVELLRNLMALGIIVCGIAWYFSRDEKRIKHKIIYVLIVILASTFHFNALMYLVILFTSKKVSLKGVYSRITCISIVSIGICNIPVFRQVLSLLFSSDKVLNWFDTSNRIGLGLVLVFAFHIISFFIYDFIYRCFYNKSNGSIVLSDNDEKQSSMIYYLNVYSFALLGLYTYNMEFFSRIYILVLIINCFHVSIMVKKIKTKNMIIMKMLQSLYQFIMFIYFCQPFNETGIMAMILDNNSLF